MNLLQEQQVILKGLLLYWNCNVCEKLGWKDEHGCPENNKDCNFFVYDKLRDHIHAIDRLKAKMK